MPCPSLKNVASLLAVFTIACGGGGGGTTDPGGNGGNNTATVSSVVVTPGSQTIAQASTATLTAQALNSTGAPISGKSFTWTSSSSSVATVANGVVTAVAAGSARITATVDGVGGHSDITVTALPVTSLTLTPNTFNLTVGQAIPLTVTTYSGSTIVSGRAVTFSTSGSTIATVSSTGVVTAVNAGTTTIRATSEGISAEATVTVTYVQAVFTQISAGDFHTCALDAAGRAYCWGGNNQSQLGNTGSNRDRPTLVSGNLTFTSISAGHNHNCGLVASGAAYCWGMNAYGQLGDNTRIERSSPVAVAGGLQFQSISGGGQHTCALTATGVAYCWGQGTTGQTGDGTNIDRLTPTAVAGGFTFSQISAHEVGVCGLTNTGRIVCWGQSPGNGDGSTVHRATPVEVDGGRIYKFLKGGGRGACAITTTDVAYCWGLQGELAGVTNNTLPYQVSSSLNFTRFSPHQRTTCAIATQGTYCWGLGDLGQLGDSTRVSKNVPTRVYGNVTFATITTGGWHSCALEPDGKTWCWGSDGQRELGTGLQFQGQGLMPVRVRAP
jgi:alpha-tubulin suppressor-like RCC1 family protein